MALMSCVLLDAPGTEAQAVGVPVRVVLGWTGSTSGARGLWLKLNAICHQAPSPGISAEVIDSGQCCMPVTAASNDLNIGFGRGVIAIDVNWIGADA